jgi:hypothetical protein
MEQCAKEGLPMKRGLLLLLALCGFLGFSGGANASLWDRGGGLIYDDVLNLTWLQDAGYVWSSGYDGNGRMTWNDAVAWADQLVYGGYDDWRLPTTVDKPAVWGYDGTTTAGYNITTSEMGYMYYVNLGNLGAFAKDGTAQTGWESPNVGPFINLGPGEAFWSGTEYSADPANAWWFFFAGGQQGYVPKDYEYAGSAWAVRDGDVSTVPIPGAVWLFGSGLIGLAGLKGKFKKG